MLLFVTVYAGYFSVKSLITGVRLNFEIESLKREIKAIEDRRAAIRKDLEKLQDEEYIKEVAKRELGMLEPGEIRYVIGAKPGE